MSSTSSNDVKLECFSGNKNEFGVWKDKLLTYVNHRDQEYQRGQLEKGKPDAKVLMADFIEGTPDKPSTPATGDTEESRWDRAHWNRGHSGLLNLFVQSPPSSFLSTLPENVSKMNPCDLWKFLEQPFGQGDAGGLIEVINAWHKILSSNWKDVRSLFAQLKKLRNDINRNTRALIGQDMVMESLLCTQVLSILPSEFWASSVSLTPDGFTIDNVEVALRKVFGDKSKKDISTHIEKKPPTVALNVMKTQNKKRKDTNEGGCFYCFATAHMKKDCATMAADKNPSRPGGPLFRTDIRTAPGQKKKKRTTTIGVATVKKNKFAPVAAAVAQELTGSSSVTASVAGTETSVECDSLLFNGQEIANEGGDYQYIGDVEEGKDMEDVDMMVEE